MTGGGGATRPHVRFATPSYSGKPCGEFLSSLERTAIVCEAAGFATSWEMLAGDCYVQRARNVLVANAIEANADYLFFLDDDLAWKPEDALRLLHMSDPFVFGAYPFKGQDGFPVVIHCDDLGYPKVRKDGCIAAGGAPTGFMRLDMRVFEEIRASRPDLEYDELDPETGNLKRTMFDYFPQGAKWRRWWGEDMAFCNLWAAIKGEMWCVPDIDFKHIARDGKVYEGNYHRYLMARPRHDAAA